MILWDLICTNDTYKPDLHYSSIGKNNSSRTAVVSMLRVDQIEYFTPKYVPVIVAPFPHQSIN